MSEQWLLQQAIAAARAGRKPEARQLLEQILQANPRHEQAWLWMGAVVETDVERVRCLQQVLAINPGNAAARKGLAQLQARTGAAPVSLQPATPPPMAQCPHCGTPNRAGATFCKKCGQDLDHLRHRRWPGVQPRRCHRHRWGRTHMVWHLAGRRERV